MGISLAKSELLIFFARVIQRSNIGVTNGKRPDPEEYFSGTTRIPKTIQCIGIIQEFRLAPIKILHIELTGQQESFSGTTRIPKPYNVSVSSRNSD